MRRTRLAIGLVVLAACSASPTPTAVPACPTQPPTALSAQSTLVDATLATVTVSGAVSGDFSIELRGEEAPLATANFVALARCGFYDGIWFHRVIAGFVIQAGDPQTKSRSGDFDTLGRGEAAGPGYRFEIEPPAETLRFDHYAVAMANDTVANGSQFFVTLADLDAQLRSVGVYTIFGAVVDGTDVIDAIEAVPVNDPRIGVPLTQVTIDHIVISSGSAPTPSGGG
jgi:dolichyl-diphosphooligosaccharide--protein glycosyltransferase